MLIRGPTNYSEVSSEAIVKDVLNEIINLTVDISEKSRRETYTKKGTLRKRKRFDTSVEERKKLKKENKISKYVIRETCNEGCPRKCTQNINKERQTTIHSEYWKLSDTLQRQFIFSSAKNTVKKKSCVGENSRRNMTVKYFLKDAEGVDFQVCKKFFLGTLGYSVHNDRIVRDVLTKMSSKELVATPAKRGHPSEKKKLIEKA